MHCGVPKLIEQQKSLYQILPHPQQQQQQRDEIECPSDIMMKHIVPALDQLLLDNRICIDEVNNIIVSRMIPVELAKSIGLIPSHIDPPAASAYAPTPSSGLNLTISQNFNSLNIPNIASSPTSSTTSTPGSFYPSGSGVGGNGGGGGGGGCGTSPIHQITKGLSGLSTGGGSITRGTSSITSSDINSEPLDLSMDVTGNCQGGKDAISGTMTAASWQVPSIFYDSNQMTLSPVQQLRLVPTPPTSPNLCIIQEEMNAAPTTTSSGVSCITFCHSFAIFGGK